MSDLHIFANGDQYVAWEQHNCGNCKKSADLETGTIADVTCDIQYAIWLAALETGKIPMDIADRCGTGKNADGFDYVWECGEFEVVQS